MRTLIFSIAVVFSLSSYGQTNSSEKTKEMLPEDIAVIIDSNWQNPK